MLSLSALLVFTINRSHPASNFVLSLSARRTPYSVSWVLMGKRVSAGGGGSAKKSAKNVKSSPENPQLPHVKRIIEWCISCKHF